MTGTDLTSDGLEPYLFLVGLTPAHVKLEPTLEQYDKHNISQLARFNSVGIENLVKKQVDGLGVWL